MKKANDGVTGDLVAEYLLEHPDFYQSRPEVFASLKLTHEAVGGISLLEKQIDLLRTKNQETSDKFFELIETARAHEHLSLTVHAVALALIKSLGAGKNGLSQAQKIEHVDFACADILHSRLPDMRVITHWFADFVDSADARVSVVNADDQRIRGLVARLYAADQPVCGPFTKPEQIVLFPNFATRPESSLVTALRQPDTGRRIGLLVFTSNEANRYSPGRGTMFLTQLVRLIEHVFSTPTGD